MPSAEQRAILRYVFEHGAWTPGVTTISCFRAAIRDARQLSGRNVDTGALRPRLRRGKAIWPGTLVYLVTVDQVGQVISMRRRLPTHEPFMDALDDFAPTLPVRDRHMLYALRCAFAHEFGLVNEGRGKHAAVRQHLFQLHEAGERKLVIYPKRVWNGRFGARANTKTGTTHVNITEVARVVEEVVATIESAATAGHLRLLQGVTPATVTSRWHFRTFEAPLP